MQRDGINLWDENKSDLGNILSGNFHIGSHEIRGGGDGNDVSQNDYMQDMSQENGSNDMMNDANAELVPLPGNGPGPKKGTYSLTPIAPLHVNNYDGFAGKLLYMWDGGNPGNGGYYNMNGELLGFAAVQLTVPDIGKSASIKITKELLSKEKY